VGRCRCGMAADGLLAQTPGAPRRAKGGLSMPAGAPIGRGRLAPGTGAVESWQGAPQVAKAGILSRLDQAALPRALYSDASRVALFSESVPCSGS